MFISFVYLYANKCLLYIQVSKQYTTRRELEGDDKEKGP